MPTLRDCVVLHGPELTPQHCPRFSWQRDTVTEIELAAPAPRLDTAALVVMPSFCNAHTHLGDGALPDGATGLTLAEGFFRPNGYKYRELAKIAPERLRETMTAHLKYMARTGTTSHVDFREQGIEGASLLRSASHSTGVRSIILSQFKESPFDAETLDTNQAILSPENVRELNAMLEIADGFSESTMNDLTDPAWREVRRQTTDQAKLRAVHCLEDESYRQTSLDRTGRGDLERAIDLLEPHLVVHLTVATADEISALARSNIPPVLNPRANMTLGLPPPPIADLLRAGAHPLLGTDNVMLNPPNLLAELDFTFRIARSQFGPGEPSRPDPADMLKMVCSHPGRLLGGDDPGTLETGKPANFVLLDFSSDHLRHTRHLLASIATRLGEHDVLATYRHGRELWRSARFSI